MSEMNDQTASVLSWELGLLWVTVAGLTTVDRSVFGFVTGAYFPRIHSGFYDSIVGLGEYQNTPEESTLFTTHDLRNQVIPVELLLLGPYLPQAPGAMFAFFAF
jgi:hypothetical protein